jgi:hypothetical protein
MMKKSAASRLSKPFANPMRQTVSNIVVALVMTLAIWPWLLLLWQF